MGNESDAKKYVAEIIFSANSLEQAVDLIKRSVFLIDFELLSVKKERERDT